MPSQFHRLGAPACSVLLVVVFSSLVEADTRVVRRGENLQAALNAALPGDVLVLEAGAEFVGNFVLPVKSGDAPIVIRSADSPLLPGAGVRMHPDQAALLARVRSPNTMSALKTAPGAHHWELRYLEFAGNVKGYGDLIQLGDGGPTAQNTLAKVPHHLVLSHLYVHGDPLVGQKRCIGLNAAHVTIRDSYISDCKGVGFDTQAIAGWNGPGPFVIENNYLEGAGENVLFGGADPAIPALVPTGIVFRRNHVTRPMAWRDPIIPTARSVAATPATGGTLAPGVYAYRIVARRHVGMGTIGRSSASAEATAVVAAAGGAVHLTWEAVPHATEYLVYGRTQGAQTTYWRVTTTAFVDTGASGTAGAVPTSRGTVWSVKNLFELKNARTVTVEDNVFENHWPQAQSGSAIVLTPRNSNGGCSWCVVEDLRFEHNLVRRVSAGFNVLGYDSPSRPSKQTRGIVVRNNLFYDMGGPYGGSGWFLLIGDAPRGLVFDHNTISSSSNAIVVAYGGTREDLKEILEFRFTNNAVRHSKYGINGEYFSFGNDVIRHYFPDSTITANYLAGGSPSRYPAGNLTEGAFELEFVDAEGGDFRLRANSQLRGKATDRGDIGADVGTLLTRVTDVEAGLPGVSVPTVPTNLRIVSR